MKVPPATRANARRFTKTKSWERTLLATRGAIKFSLTQKSAPMAGKSSHNGIVLQDRDHALLRRLTEDFRILSREQIGELFPMGSVARLNFRLKQLRDAGYLSSRPLAGLGTAVKRGYYLGPRAIELLSDPIERRVATSVRSQAAQLAPAGLEHRMLVDSVHIRFLTAARAYPKHTEIGRD